MDTSPDQRRVPIKHLDKFFIGGEWVQPSTSSTIEVRTPATEELYMQVAEAQPEDIDRAVNAARHAFDNGPWPRLSHAERASYLSAFAEKINERLDDLGVIWPNEMGIVHSLATQYLSGVGSTFQYYAQLADTFPFVEEHDTESGSEIGLLVREPVGVVGAIVPWNGPMMLIAVKTAPALLAGCTVVIKASPEAPGQALLFAEIAEEIGLPKGVVNVLTADRSASESLVRHDGVDKITFTGSSLTGKRIAAIMGERLARYTLELGGKSAAIVLDDYDIDVAAQAIAQSTCGMTGQVCAALTRIVVPNGKHDKLVEALGAHLSSVKIGDPFDPSTEMGPLASERQRARVENYIGAGKDAGFTLATGGERPRHLNRGFFIEPTVFGNVDNSSTIAQEEIFGPVLSVIRADNENQAIEIANDSRFGLNGTVFTNDLEKAYSVARQLRTGNVGHNGYRMDFGIAFGGFKESGIGREGGVEGLLPFCETKTVLLDGMPVSL